MKSSPQIVALVESLAEVRLANVFNPYRDTCSTFDDRSASATRRKNLTMFLSTALRMGVDTVWMGRDLGYRGGRRTGIALTDESHLASVGRVYPGHTYEKVTTGPYVAERTATEVWSYLHLLKMPPLLWNVFPFHPHEPHSPLTNRKFSSVELSAVTCINLLLMKTLGIRRIVAIGQDAASYAQQYGTQVVAVRHPSYGGTSQFRSEMTAVYGVSPRPTALQQSLL